MEIVDAGEELQRMAGGGEDRIFVSVRLRPLNEKEIARKDFSDWECINDNTIIFKNANLSLPERSMYPTAYTFDRVFRSDTSTRQVYEEGAKEVALSVVSGINSSVFAYGQTSSGKTYTMTGITQYTIADIYDYIQKHKEREFILKFSAMEIYNESVRDLLSSDASPMRLLDDPERGTVVEKLTEETLRDWNHLLGLLSVCEAQRQIGETALNETSSRSHQIIRLSVESSPCEFLGRDNSSTLMASVNFVDLAGSERASQSLSAGARLKEGCHINRSLLTLGTVIRKLSKGRNGHIPFRDSKLTRILQSSLGGNARTAIICTMSPARSHVEQSRNTLLFASCAKEVTTSAHVNVVISDKALVKHLKRELARLESELRCSDSSSVASKYVDIMREKELQMEKMEKEIKELTLQRDMARSQVQELLQLVGDKSNPIARVGSWGYPHLRVRVSPEPPKRMQEMSVPSAPYTLNDDFQTHDTYQYSDECLGDSSDEQCIRLSDEKILKNNTSPGLFIAASSFSDSDSCNWAEIEDKSNGNSEDLCKDVWCIEVEESTIGKHVESICPSSQKSHIISARTEVDGTNGVQEGLVSLPLKQGERFVLPHLEEETELVSRKMKEEVELVSSPLQDDKRLVEHPLQEAEKFVLTQLEEDDDLEEVVLVSSPLQEDKELVEPPLKEDRKLNCKLPVVISFPERSSPPNDLTQNLADSKIIKLIRSRSCEAKLMSSLSSSWLENVGNYDRTPPNGSQKDFNGTSRSFLSHSSSWLNHVGYCESTSPNESEDLSQKPRNFRKQSSVLDDGAYLGKLSRKESQSSVGSAFDIILEAQDGKCSNDENSGEKMPETGHEKQVADVDTPVKEVNKTIKSFKDVGLDPMEDDLKVLKNWPSEFRRLQREIIRLWHACNVSLLHRTYFFLLFNGEDSADSIYMEVELRRLFYLNDSFCRRSKNMEEGCSFSVDSSSKTERRERKILSKQMQKRFSEQERESLYIKWGIGLHSRNRRLQLAHRLWTKTEEEEEAMDHIKDSAILVAKLIGFNAHVQASKQMFRLNFDSQTSRSFCTFRRGFIPLV